MNESAKSLLDFADSFLLDDFLKNQKEFLFLVGEKALTSSFFFLYDFYDIYFLQGVVMHKRKQAFTLIELLVVVLIIGILAAIALPQYTKAVEKSKASQAFAIVRSIAAAQEAYYMENGTYATSFDQLAVNIPWTGTVQWSTGMMGTATKSNEDWSVQIYNHTFGKGLSIGRISGEYAGAGFIYLLEANPDYNYNSKELICMERSIRTETPFTKVAGAYCRKFFPQMPYKRVQ